MKFFNLLVSLFAESKLFDQNSNTCKKLLIKPMLSMVQKSIIVPFFLILVSIGFCQSQTTLHSESFETDGEGSRYFSNTYYETSPNCNFFARMASSPLDACFQNNLFFRLVV